jgi:hypothetical protein
MEHHTPTFRTEPASCLTCGLPIPDALWWLDNECLGRPALQAPSASRILPSVSRDEEAGSSGRGTAPHRLTTPS